MRAVDITIEGWVRDVERRFPYIGELCKSRNETSFGFLFWNTDNTPSMMYGTDVKSAPVSMKVTNLVPLSIRVPRVGQY